MLRLASLLILASLANLSLSQLSPPFTGARQDCYDTQVGGVQGFCEHNNCCSGANYVSGLCQDYPNQVLCCYSHNACSRAGGCENSCPAAARTTACQILRLYEERKIFLKPDHFNSAGNNPYDGASSLSEIRDMCYGRQAKRSAYGVAPGGCVCLQNKMLTALYDYALQFWNAHGVRIEVNAIAGSEHSATSWHYEGNTFDVACTTPLNHCQALIDFCRARDPVEMCYPGSSCGGHETWVHCAL